MNELTITRTIGTQKTIASALWDWAENDGNVIVIDSVTCSKGALELADDALNLALEKIKTQTATAIVTAASENDLDSEHTIYGVVAFYEKHGFRVSDVQGGESVFMERKI